MIELMPTDQPFGLGFAQRAEKSRALRMAAVGSRE
jgi:hypothetical protein